MEKLWIELGLPVPNQPSSEWTPIQHTDLESWNLKHEESLRSWAKDLNLHYDWLLSEAASQLTTWRSFPEFKGVFAGILGYQAPRFHIEPWFNEDEREYRKRAKAKFSSTLEAHIRDVKQLQSRLMPDRGSQAAHYRWAAEHVCLGQTWSNIARLNGTQVTWQAVRKAVQRILKKIGIPSTTT